MDLAVLSDHPSDLLCDLHLMHLKNDKSQPSHMASEMPISHDYAAGLANFLRGVV